MSSSSNIIYTVPWYPNEYPKEHDAVIVRLTRVDELGIWVELLEYASKEGMIPIGQYTTRKTRRVPKNVKVGKIAVALVSRVDAEQKSMDLTRQGIKPEDIKDAEKRFSDYKNFVSLLYYVSTKVETVPFPELVQKIVYPLHEKSVALMQQQEDEDHQIAENAYTLLLKSVRQPELLNGLEIPDQVKEVLFDQLKKISTPTEVRIHGLFEAEVLTAEGVDALREALSSGYELEKEIVVDDDIEGLPEKDKGPKLSLTVIAPPIYSVSYDVYNAEKGMELVKKVLERIEQRIKAVKGRFAIKEEPKIINQIEFAKFQARLDELATDGDTNVDMDQLNE
ncbi:hypothetical protein M9Y10_006410 [Tritrichomonas musculus]|uniref:S1 motif domain-containing protein n=1 Tax=Tritrichomonas musculus TaxID=1915356 RepID=A0ABR2JEB6_9EUKA